MPTQDCILQQLDGFPKGSRYQESVLVPEIRWTSGKVGKRGYKSNETSPWKNLNKEIRFKKNRGRFFAKVNRKRSCTQSFFSLTCTHTHTHTHARTLSLSLPHTHSLSLSPIGRSVLFLPKSTFVKKLNSSLNFGQQRQSWNCSSSTAKVGTSLVFWAWTEPELSQTSLSPLKIVKVKGDGQHDGVRSFIEEQQQKTNCTWKLRFKYT